MLDCKIKKILIANRGEIAVRIIRTCKSLGIKTVAVFSSADKKSLHVKLADETVCIGPERAIDSYLNISSILMAAINTGSDAIHPGYGFLAENSKFAKTCKDNDIIFIGPNENCLERMGDKIQSKKIAIDLGIPVLEPIKVDELVEKDIINQVLEMGFPVIIKASAGGGGRGMQRIDKESDLLPALKRLQAEAQAAFGDGTLFIEKFVTSPRHIEVQIIADKHGNCIHLGERDCTIQRSYQKIIEESFALSLNDEVRRDMRKSALKLSEDVGLDSAGTVEFLYDQFTCQYYFMEMNTRIQVEHPVTEMVTDLDIIALQIQVADDKKLKLSQKDIQFKGHSLECRINAEDAKTFTPSPGTITSYVRPEGKGIRVDDFIFSGHEVSPYYDSLLAKVVVYGKDRTECISLMEQALGVMKVEGVKTNIPLHQKIFKNKLFKDNEYATNFLTVMDKTHSLGVKEK